MKKPFSLDYTIERDIDRLAAIETILDELPTRPSNADLEIMASYILYGKDENGQNAINRKETYDANEKRYNTYRKAEDKAISLDEILDDPLADHAHFKELDARRVARPRPRVPQRPKRDRKTGEWDMGDADIPGMTELWEAIDRTEHTYLANKGDVDFNKNDSIITDPYRLWQLKHQLVDMRRHQYYLLDAYKPTLRFNAIAPSTPQTYNWDGDTFYWMDYDQWKERVQNTYNYTISKKLEDYETREIDGKLQVKWVVKHHHFDWENPFHIKALINNYSDIYMQLWDKPDSWGRTLLFDFDRYFDMCHFSEVREYVITRRIDKAKIETIRDELQEKFGINYKVETVMNIVGKEVPNKIAKVAEKERLIFETPRENCKQCSRCKRWLPISPVFFIRNRSKKYGLENACKECTRQRRIERGVQGEYDRRSKDPKMF